MFSGYFCTTLVNTQIHTDRQYIQLSIGVLKATIENKTTSVTTHFKNVTTGYNVFIVSVIV